jgi:hypothetical protein
LEIAKSSPAVVCGVSVAETAVDSDWMAGAGLVTTNNHMDTVVVALCTREPSGIWTIAAMLR